MAGGWGKLGNVLGGGVDRQDAFMQGRYRSAQTEDALARAKVSQAEAIAKDKQNQLIDQIAGAQDPLSHDIFGALIASGHGSDYSAIQNGMNSEQTRGFKTELSKPGIDPARQQELRSAIGDAPFNPLNAVGTHGAYTDARSPDSGVQLSDEMIPTDAMQKYQEYTKLGGAPGADSYARFADPKQTGAAADKAPAGYQWVTGPDGTRTQAFVPGGPADPSVQKPGSREAIFTQRIVNGGNAATAALRNIVELPVGASSGIMGVGSQPGHSVFQATRDALRNKLSSQEVQDYNTMVAGVSRNLATLETAGLAPSGAFIDSLNSLQFREGDTGMTKLRKLAEMRQIIEVNLEPSLSSPRIPPEQKQLIKKIIADAGKAIPFTHSDVSALQREQAKNPDATMNDLIRQNGLDKPAAPAAAPAAANAPAVGTVEDGFKFKGGNPGDPNSWEQVQ